MAPPIDGAVDQRFAAVRDAFAGNLDAGEVGAACCVVLGGRPVVDLWGGWADAARTRPWSADTLVNAYSCGKPIVALAVLALVADGKVDLDASAARWWPELLAGQQGATVRDLLCHRAGVPAIRERLTDDDLWDWDAMAGAVARTEPWWEPGSRHAYHTNTYGFLAGELTRRTGGLRPGAWLREQVAGPLGADLAWGLDAAEQARTADVVWQAGELRPTWDELQALPEERAMVALGYVNPPGFSGIGVVNSAAWRSAEVPSTNLHASARGLARLYEVLAAGGSIDRVHVIDRDVLAEAIRAQSEGWCPVLEREVTFGLGFQPSRPDRPLGAAGSFGHYGTGGSLGFADPEAGLAFGYVMNAVRPRWQSERNRALVDAVYACL
jgi:CubicO group peptidase (beta-lactamase class C family)